MNFFAHTRKNSPETEWEPISHHLAEVATLAGSYGRRFGVEALTAMAGRLHDLGKYSAGFQARLRGSTQRVDHSTAGAVWASTYLPFTWGRLIAHAVAGHHAGLQDGLFDPEGRIDNAKAGLPDIEAKAAEDRFELPRTPVRPSGLKSSKGEEGFQLAFLTRMAFSCLIDADRMAAKAFDEGKTVEDIVERHPSLPELEAALHDFFAQRASLDSDLNRLRSKVLSGVLKQAENPPGVFTLTVPTGGGKTLTSLAFALAHARAHGLERVIVVIPYTSIIEQTADVYRKALAPCGDAVLEHHSAFECEDESGWAQNRVGPERLRLAMERWDNPIVVTTAVQFFESLFANRASRCRKLHSVARSVVVIDEAQTLPLPLLRPCVAALKELTRNYGGSVVLCTATQPALSAGTNGASGFDGGFDAPPELAPGVPELFAALRRVTVRVLGEQSDEDLVQRIAASPQALCIVNRRDHALALFRAISHLPGARHLSTRMHPVHRARVLAGIREDLRPDCPRPCRVISTSLVEAGVDVDFPLVLRAMAGLDQIAQAAGRCNREFGRSAADSEVLVFDSSAHPPIEQLRVQAEAGREMLKLYAADPFSPEALRAYFEMVYWRKGHEKLDKHDVLKECADRVGDLNFRFKTIAERMRFINDTMTPVIVPKGETHPGEAKTLIDALTYTEHGVGNLARKLGRYTVNLPRPARMKLIAAKAARIIRPEIFGDQFVVLENLDLYEAETGLDWNDPTFRKIEGLMSC